MQCKEKGISVITCSVNPELCNQMLESVKNTIGTDFETIIFDNREKKLGICQVYNICAKKASFSYLCFIHEDVILSTTIQHWGVQMIEFAEVTPKCGVIGFAGGTIAARNYIGWWCDTKGRYRYYDSGINGKSRNISDLSYQYNNPENEEFAKVVTLDGFFLFVSKKIWKENPFDEEMIKGFHFYDADFSFSVAQRHQNYACLITDIYHFSSGNRDRAYYENVRIFQKKWRDKLPYIIGKQKVDLIEEINCARELFIRTLENGFTVKDNIKHLLAINGLFFSFIFCLLMPSWIIEKVINKTYKIVVTYFKGR